MSYLRPIALFLPLLFCLGAKPPVARLALDGNGGDAWTFHKEVTGSIASGACDAVVISAPASTVTASLVGERFSATIPLQEGSNELRALCREGDRNQAASAPQRWIERLPDLPKAEARTVISAGSIVLDGTGSQSAAGHPAPLLRYRWHAEGANPTVLSIANTGAPLDSAEGAQIHLSSPVTDGTYAVALTVLDAYGRTDTSRTVFRVAHGMPEAIDMRDHPTWIDDAIVYGAIPFFFGDGRLADVTARLDAIAALGATVLWLSPITEGPDRDFGYAVTDHFHVRPSLGSAADLRALVQAAHARKLRVILDVAANHLSDQHPYFRDAAECGRASPYYDFFARDAAGHATHYFDWANLENLNYDNPELRNYAIEAFARWVRDFDVDGFRVDAAWGVKQRDADFWPRWRAELKRIKPDLLLLAEAPAGDGYFGKNGFDAAYDWSAQLGRWAWQDAFNAVDPVPGLRAALAASRHDDALVFRFLDNNDTGLRFFVRHGLRVTRVAAAMLLTLPGLPEIYMGDEVGAEFLPYGERRPLDWSGGSKLRDYYTRLTALRHAEPALRSRDMILIDTPAAPAVLAYLRPGPTPAEDILVLLNYGTEASRVPLAGDDHVGAMIGDDTRLLDLITGEAIAIDPTQPSVALPALSARVLRRAGTR